MAFRVEIEPQAFDDLDEMANWIKSGSSFDTAQKWFNGMIAAIATLRGVHLKVGGGSGKSLGINSNFDGPKEGSAWASMFLG